MLVCRLPPHFCTRDRGCSAHPAFPAPSLFEGERNANLGQDMPRDRECVPEASGQSAWWRGLFLIERNILMIFFRHRTAVASGHRAAIDRAIDLLLPGHLRRLLFLRPRLVLVRRSRIRRRGGRGCSCWSSSGWSCSGWSSSGWSCGSRSGGSRSRRRCIGCCWRALGQRSARRQHHEGRRRCGDDKAGKFLHETLHSGLIRWLPDTITFAAARTPGFWRSGPRRTGYA